MEISLRRRSTAAAGVAGVTTLVCRTVYAGVVGEKGCTQYHLTQQWMNLAQGTLNKRTIVL